MRRVHASEAAGPQPPVRIARLAAGGDGVGRLDDGRTLFVPRSAPGDLIEVADLRLHKRYARGRIGKLLEPGEGRTAPVCPHFDGDRCGGCQWQHLDLVHQRRAKSAIIGDALRRLGKLEVADPEVVAGHEAWRYRTKITLARGKEGRLGLHREGEPDRIFALERCELIAPKLQETWDRLRPRQSFLPATLERLVLRLDREGRVHIVVETSDQQVWPAGSLGDLAVVWWRPMDGAPRVVAGGDGRTAYPATVFEQVNPSLGDEVRRWAVRELGPVSGHHGWDLYAGIGETTDLLLAGGATVESVEGDRRAVELGEKRNPRKEARRISGRVEDVLGELRRADFVITNPPRIGMHERVAGALAGSRPPRVAYISCDPATLARDVARFGEGYRVTSVKGFDLFPQTAHVETVLVLEAQ